MKAVLAALDGSGFGNTIKELYTNNKHKERC